MPQEKTYQLLHWQPRLKIFESLIFGRPTFKSFLPASSQRKVQDLFEVKLKSEGAEVLLRKERMLSVFAPRTSCKDPGICSSRRVVTRNELLTVRSQQATITDSWRTRSTPVKKDRCDMRRQADVFRGTLTEPIEENPERS